MVNTSECAKNKYYMTHIAHRRKGYLCNNKISLVEDQKDKLPNLYFLKASHMVEC